jgi:hypothetical protein
MPGLMLIAFMDQGYRVFSCGLTDGNAVDLLGASPPGGCVPARLLAEFGIVDEPE